MSREITPNASNEDLRLAVTRAASWRGVMRELGYATTGGATSAILQRRAKALGYDTSHFGSQPRPTKTGIVCTCQTCSRQYIYDRRKGSTVTRCNSCHVNGRRFALKVKIVAWLGGKCIDCGFTGCLAALHVHHLEANGKDFNLSGAHARSWASIEAELKKCVLVCANCHAARHHDHVRGLCPVGSIPSAL